MFSVIKLLVTLYERLSVSDNFMNFSVSVCICARSRSEMPSHNVRFESNIVNVCQVGEYETRAQRFCSLGANCGGEIVLIFLRIEK